MANELISSMFKSLADYFNQHLGNDQIEDLGREHTLELCAAVLMLEIALADSNAGEEELDVIEKAMSEHFHLQSDEIREILNTARNEVDHATSLHEFTKNVNEWLDPNEKATVIELLWRVAVADKVIDKYEEYFIRKIADLLYVPHKDYIRAKHRASE